MVIDAASQLRTIDVRGTRLAYREQGAGEPVVFVHGGASDLRTWDTLVAALGRTHRAISYSRRYAHPNAPIPPDADDPMQPHVDDLAGVLRALDASPAHLVGHSWGGFICLLAAIQQPALVRSLVLEEPPVLTLFVSGKGPRPAELLRLLATRPRTAIAILRFGARTIAPARAAFARGDTERAVEVYGRGVLGDAGFEQLSPARLDQVRDNIAADRAQLLGEGFPPLSASAVRSLRTPVLLLTGSSSPALFLRLTDHLHELLPNATRAEIPDASHLLHEQNSAAVESALREFLGSITSTARIH